MDNFPTVANVPNIYGFIHEANFYAYHKWRSLFGLLLGPSDSVSYNRSSFLGCYGW